jgi:kynurenine formamidase
MNKLFRIGAALLALASFGLYGHGSLSIDLSHPIPTFAPSSEDPMKPDLSAPYHDSKPIPTFGAQAVLSFGKFPTSDGYFNLGTMVLAEHHGTHLDSPGHYANNAASLEGENPPAEKRKHTHDLNADDLIGHVVLIDISGRVEMELAKNGGVPSPDTAVTDFSNASPNVVTADDIVAVEKQINKSRMASG